MARRRRRFTPEFKARVALQALRERDSGQAIAARHELHPNQVRTWKRQLIEGLPEVFAGQRNRGGVNDGSPNLPGRALLSQRAREATWGLPVPGAWRQQRPSPARGEGNSTGERGSLWHQSFSWPKRTEGCRIHPKKIQSENSRGLSQPVGVHLSFDLGCPTK